MCKITHMFQMIDTSVLELLYNFITEENDMIFYNQYDHRTYLSESNAMQIVNEAYFGKTKEVMKTTTIGVIIKTISLIILCFAHVGIYALIISEIINIVIVIFLNYKAVKKILF